MRILESTTVGGWKQNYRCTNCSSLLEVDAMDMHGNAEESDALFFVCPVCQGRNWLKKAGLPLDVVCAVFDREEAERLTSDGQGIDSACGSA